MCSKARRSSVRVRHPVAHADLREDVLGLGGIFLDLPSDIGHIDPRDASLYSFWVRRAFSPSASTWRLLQPTVRPMALNWPDWAVSPLGRWTTPEHCGPQLAA